MAKYKFNNIVEYVRRQMATFEEVPFGELDSLVFTWLVYFHFVKNPEITYSLGGMNLRDIFKAEDFPAMFQNVWTVEDSYDLLAACVASPRYRRTQLIQYREEKDQGSNKQFAAVTLQIAPDVFYVCYRGTDWSLAGWEEDFKLSLKNPVPSQKIALEYLNHIAEMYQGKLYVGGHSKGGNLAVYAAAHTSEEIQDRIVTVYSHDGPGFLHSDFECPGFARIRSKIEKTVPKFSVFGMLFEQEADHKIVKSHEVGMMQHNTLSWEVEGDHLVEEKSFSAPAQHIQERLNEWVDDLDYGERSKFIDIVFDLLESTGEESFDQIKKNWYSNVKTLFRSARTLDPDEQDFMKEKLQPLFRRSKAAEEENVEKADDEAVDERNT